MAKENMTFEQSMDRLQKIVAKLEENNTSLDDTIALFEEGLGLIKECDSSLKRFENKMNDIKKKNEENA